MRLRLGKAFNSSETVIGRVSQVAGIAAIVFLIVMMAITVTDVILRYFFFRPLTISKEFTEYLMVLVTFLSLAWCAFKRKHIAVDILVSRFSQRSQTIIDNINALIVLAVCVIIGWRSFAEMLVVRQMQSGSEMTGIPYWPFYWVVAFGYFLMTLAMITVLVNSILKVANR